MTQRKLVIVESPTKAKKIGGYLGKEYEVLASVGHIRDLAQPTQIPATQRSKYGKFGVDVEHDFKPYYVVGADKKKTVAELKAALKESDELYLATDEDREGEAIAWHLVQTLKPKIPVHRMVFHEITKKAIQESLQHTRTIDEDMVQAQETRRVLDRLYGYELSPVLWRKVGPKLSAGRVQSVATRMIVERERERIAFVPAQYCDLTATIAVPNHGEQSSATDANTYFDARLVQLGGKRLVVSKDFDSSGKLKAAKEGDVELLRLSLEQFKQVSSMLLQQQTLTVATMQRKPYHRRPLPPFTTSTLQQAAGNTLSMSSRQTMRAAQALYENGYITYMRTDSVTLSQEAIHAARQAVTELYGSEYLSEGTRQYANKSAGAQEAHECIRPAGSMFRRPDELATVLSPDQLRLYTLIFNRTLACQMADATGYTATVQLTGEAGEFGQALLQASGTVVEFPGFQRAFGKGLHKASGATHAQGAQSAQSQGTQSAGESQDTVLPDMHEGDQVLVSDTKIQDHETQPPARFTEASLVRTLEAEEIGRPSTYASIISTIIERGYVYERGRALIPSWLAFAVIRLLESEFPKYVDYRFTADMESGLDLIARGEQHRSDWLAEFYEGLQHRLEHLPDIDAREINTIAIGEGLQVRIGRYGPFLEDTARVDDEGNPARAAIPPTVAPDELTVQKARELMALGAHNGRELGVDPQSGLRIVVKNGRYGPYVAEDRDDEVKPKMASLFSSMSPETVTLEQAVALLSLPRHVGTMTRVVEKTGELVEVPVVAANGRYGPYVTLTMPDGSADSRSLSSEDEIFTVTIDQARELFDQPKRRGRRSAKPPLRALGEDPESGKPVVIKDGFYGLYITDGTTNVTLPKQYTHDSIEPETAFALLSEKRAAGPTVRKSAAKKAATKKSAAKKATATKSTVKKATATKTAEKKTVAKKTATKAATATKSAAKSSAASA